MKQVGPGDEPESTSALNTIGGIIRIQNQGYQRPRNGCELVPDKILRCLMLESDKKYLVALYCHMN